MQFTGKFPHAIMVMLKAVSQNGYPSHPEKHLSATDVFLPKIISPMQLCMAGAGILLKGFPAFLILLTGCRSLKNKKIRQSITKLGPGRKKFRSPHQKLLTGAAAFTYFFALCPNQAYATDMWTKADTIMKDVYGKIVGISTIAAIVTASVALLLMNFSKSGKTVDESRAWLKRIAISWVILNGLGFILAYVSPFFADGKWNG